MPRMARIIAVDYPHHVVQRGNNKQTIFFDEHDKQLYLELLKKYSKGCLCNINAYCLMPNHVHALLTPLTPEALSKTMQKLSLRYTQLINKKYARTGRLWECRFHSTVVQKEAYLWAVCRYIERNPVRAKMVAAPGHYKWSSANRLSKLNDGLIDSIWIHGHEMEEYTRFLNLSDNQDEITKIRQSTARGIPLGSKNFIRQMAEQIGVTITTKPPGRPRVEIEKLGTHPN